jgi:hypothetical protein
MTGVDILAMEEVAVEFAFNWAAFAITFLGIPVILSLVGTALYNAGYYDRSVIIALVIVGLVAGLALGIIFGFEAQTPTKYVTQYKVTISDEVSMTEFLEKYEIIETEGKIFTVKEK